jgi:putative glutamine amidotransferase
MPVRIGITTSFEDGKQRLDRRYVTAVETAGGAPLLLPTTEATETVEALVDQIDGLVVPGGPAVTEGLTGPLPDDLGALDPLRADSDRRWISACWRAGRPILGICYGMQRLNALAGGTIYGDVEAEHEGANAHSQKRGGTTHPVTLDASSRLHRWIGTDALDVNTRHLQAPATVGDGFSVAATAPDGVIEAIEHESGRLFGVQFHPERMGAVTQPLFEALIKQARAGPMTASA